MPLPISIPLILLSNEEVDMAISAEEVGVIPGIEAPMELVDAMLMSMTVLRLYVFLMECTDRLELRFLCNNSNKARVWLKRERWPAQGKKNIFMWFV